MTEMTMVKLDINQPPWDDEHIIARFTDIKGPVQEGQEVIVIEPETTGRCVGRVVEIDYALERIKVWFDWPMFANQISLHRELVNEDWPWHEKQLRRSKRLFWYSMLISIVALANIFLRFQISLLIAMSVIPVYLSIPYFIFTRRRHMANCPLMQWDRERKELKKLWGEEKD